MTRASIQPRQWVASVHILLHTYGKDQEGGTLHYLLPQRHHSTAHWKSTRETHVGPGPAATQFLVSSLIKWI